MALAGRPAGRQGYDGLRWSWTHTYTGAVVLAGKGRGPMAVTARRRAHAAASEPLTPSMYYCADGLCTYGARERERRSFYHKEYLRYASTGFMIEGFCIS